MKGNNSLQPALFFKCLSDETRLNATLLIFREGELCVCELMAALDDSQPKISRHLAQLRNCGVLDDERRGLWVYYSLAKNLPQWAMDILEASAQGSMVELKGMAKNLRSMRNRPNCC